MNDKVKQLWEKTGGAAAVLGGMLLAPWALWAFGRGRRSRIHSRRRSIAAAATTKR